MINQTYTLKNHYKTDDPTTIKATIKFHQNHLILEYQILGNLSNYHFPKTTTQQRADNLWLHLTPLPFNLHFSLVPKIKFGY